MPIDEKTARLGLGFRMGATTLKESLVQCAAHDQLAKLLLAKAEAGDLIIIEDPHIALPDSFDASKLLLKLESKPMNEKQRGGMGLLAAAVAALFPPHLMGTGRDKKVKRVYGKCLSCGNPCKDSVCRKCQNGPAIELKG